MIIYALVARGSTILAEHAAKTGNFQTVTKRILEKIPPQDGKASYVFDRTNLYIYVWRKKKKKRKYKNSGLLQVLAVSEYIKPSFLDYIKGGCEISLMVAIDFTASNGAAQHPNSLHTMRRENDYVRAIRAVGGVLGSYDSDQNFPVWGFGAKCPPAWQVSHCFPVNGNPANPEVHGVEGIVQAYSSALSTVQLYGPTIFGHILQGATEVAQQYVGQNNQKYFVLLILTDGVINDMPKTIERIVNASGLPLSIVIVGIGNADFSNMEELDGDDGCLQYMGRRAQRDIVQFVPFSRFAHSPAALAKETLAEIPGQLMSYMISRSLMPNPPRQAQAIDQAYQAYAQQQAPAAP